MELAYTPAEENPLVRAVCRDAGFPAGVDLAIHAGDEMLAFLAGTRGGDRDRALADYFLSGFRYTRIQESDWAELYLTVGNKYLTGQVALMGSLFSDWAQPFLNNQLGTVWRTPE